MAHEQLLSCSPCDAVMLTADPLLVRTFEAEHADCPVQACGGCGGQPPCWICRPDGSEDA